MKISTEQLNKVLEGKADTPVTEKVDEAVIRLTDKELISETVAKVNATPDRMNMVEELKAKIEAGTYNPTGEEIADSMIRRNIADRIR